MSDADTLRAAAAILYSRSKKPKSFWLGVLCKVLNDTAVKIDRGTL